MLVCAGACVYVCAYALRILSPGRILSGINTLIINDSYYQPTCCSGFVSLVSHLKLIALKASVVQTHVVPSVVPSVLDSFGLASQTYSTES